jgi:hypothetical protein
MNLGRMLELPLAARLIDAAHVDVDPNWLAVASARVLTDAQIWRLFELAVSGLAVALCLHHVSRKSRDQLTIPAPELDEFIERARRIRHASGRRWLTVSFDDGYEDAWHYVMTRAGRFPDVEWVFFVCPEKAEHQTGFRWDLDVVDDDSPRDLTLENRRADLRSVVHLSDAHLATVEQCRRLQMFDNVHLGNHTNCHFRASDLPLPEALAELRQSHADFERLFGPERHFAFPFGGQIDFNERHVAQLRSSSAPVIWTTVGRPHLHAHRFPGAVLPRFAVDGRWTASQAAFWIALRSLRERARGIPRLLEDAPWTEEPLVGPGRLASPPAEPSGA